LRSFAKNHERTAAKSLGQLLPECLVGVGIKESGIDPARRTIQLIREEKQVNCRQGELFP
jgi:hypothetical protein